MVGFRAHELRIAAVDHHAGDHSFAAQVLEPFAALLALPARTVQPRDADTVADLQMRDVGTALHDSADHFVPRDERQPCAGLEAGQVAVRDVQVGMAHAAGVDLQQHFIGQGLGSLHLFDAQRLTEVVQASSFHACTYLMVASRALTPSLTRDGK